MLRTHRAIVVWFCLVGFVAADIIVPLEFKKSGRYVVEIVVNSDGTATARALKVHTIDGDSVTPTDPTPVDPVDLSEAAKTVKNLTAALDVEAELIEAIKIMYGTVGDSVRDGSIAVESANKAIATATNAIGRRGGVKVRRELEPWRKGVSDVLVGFAKAGNYDTKDEIADALEEIVSGIQAYQDSSGLFSRLDPEKIQRWLEFILKIIKLFMAL